MYCLSSHFCNLLTHNSSHVVPLPSLAALLSWIMQDSSSVLVMCLSHMEGGGSKQWPRSQRWLTAPAQAMTWPLPRLLEEASTQGGASLLAQLPWGLFSVPDPLPHCANRPWGITNPSKKLCQAWALLRYGRGTTVPEMEVCLQEGMTQKLMRLVRAKSGHLCDTDEML